MTVYRRNPLLMTVMGANPGPRSHKTAERALDKAIGSAWHRLMSGVQVSVMDIPRIFRDIKLEISGGMPLEEAVLKVGGQYRVNPNPRGFKRAVTQIEVDPTYITRGPNGYAEVTHVLKDATHISVYLRMTDGPARWVKDFRGNSRGVVLRAFAYAHKLAQQYDGCPVVGRFIQDPTVRRNPFGEAIVAGVASAVASRALQSNPKTFCRNPGPAFIVIDSDNGYVVWSHRATGTGDVALRKAIEKAKAFTKRRKNSHVVFLDMGYLPVGSKVDMRAIRVQGVSAEFHPDDVGMPSGRRCCSAPDPRPSGQGVRCFNCQRWEADNYLEGMRETPKDCPHCGASYIGTPQMHKFECPPQGGGKGMYKENPHLEDHQCATCGGSLAYQGTLGNREHYRCRNCGLDVSTTIVPERRSRSYKKTCAHGRITNTCPSCRGRKMTARTRPCIHGSADATRCVACSRHQRPGGPVQNNPAIRKSWDTLTRRQRRAILEFAGVDEEQAYYLSGKSWETMGALDADAQRKVTMGWRDSDRAPRGTGTRRRHETTVRMNPQANPGGRRKMTMTVERFAAWVKSKKDPAMWRAFLAKFKGYEKWTHGARARKVHLEWVDTPGVNGLWITYDGGKQPESTYIMPKGSKRKGAWKHPWDTMPDIKHDPEAKIVITKLRGSSKITDFYHK